MLTFGVFLALASSAVWGAGDFLGGLATRRMHHFQVVALSAISGIVMLIAFAMLFREPWLQPRDVVLSALSGASGGFGIAMLYRGLSMSHAALVAPTAAVVGAVLPLMVSIFRVGWPRPAQLAGFICALGGIWLVAKSAPATSESLRGLRVAIAAGLGLGGFLALIALVPAQLVFGPLIVSRAVSLIGALVVLRLARAPGLRSGAVPIAVITGVLDAGGNVFYVFARQYTRLDVAAVLASLYPMSTVLLARIFLSERISTTQAIGVGLCLTAVALIALGSS